MRTEDGLEGRTALVTGVNNVESIGFAAARALLDAGARVFAHGWRWSAPGPAEEPPEPGPERYRWLGAQPLAAALERLGEGRQPVPGLEADLAAADAAARLYDAAEAAIGPVEMLVHAAAISEPDGFQDAPEVSASSIDRHFAVNARSAALLMAEHVRRHRARGARWGRVVQVSTDAAPGHAGAVSYGASKAALESYARAFAWETGPLGMTANVVAPGPVQSGWIDAALEADLLPMIPARRLGRPEDVAAAILFLCSPRAAWITGQVIQVGGGHVMPR